ncbi:hypothetical protein [Enterobacter sp. DE0047]|uniref:hypothetical protein n=1 Tax=Enterobacter sp. DE0047 TaxID=2584949 RepID=UPI0011A0EFF9|nr:hypothetical protein [Enterobacter sp. DE0047]
MKLIEILVRDLHKFGGWPAGAVECQRFVDEANIDFYDANGNWEEDCFLKYGAFAQEAVRERTQPCQAESVTREQYEAALAASKEMLVNKPVAWDGQGLPTVGQRCDFYSALEGRWLPVQIEAVTKDGVAFTWLTDELSYSGLDCVRTENALFRAPLSAEEMARIGIIDNFIKIMAGYIEGGLKPEIIRERLYQHLPLLPGVKVEAPDA